MSELVYWVLAEIAGGAIPVRVHTAIVTAITGACAVAMGGLAAYSGVLAIEQLHRLALGRALVMLAGLLFFAGVSAYCSALMRKGLRSLRHTRGS